MEISECSGLMVFRLFLKRMKQSPAKYPPFIVSALLLWVAVYLLFPHCRYYIDPDGTAYLTISARYASGDYYRAINGLWSPWGCWLTALLIKAGIQAVPASIIVNTAGGTGFLLLAHSLFARFNMEAGLRWIFGVTLALFTCFAVFWQSFDDLWQCFFLLLIVRTMLADRYRERPGFWVLAGVIGAFSYFSKAYSLHFFILSTLCCSWFLSGRQIGLWARMVIVPVTVALICSFPWIYALHYKYGIWATSNAGKLIVSWFLVGHPNWKEGIDILVPPIYGNSPYYWEDPYQVNGVTVGFLDSWYLFGYQVIRCCYNGLMLIYCWLQLSVVVPVLNVFIFLRLFFAKKFPGVTDEERILYLTILLLPAGYVMVHLESRYLWATLPLCIIVVARYIQNYPFKNERKRQYVIIGFAASILAFPLWTLPKLYDEGKQEYDFAMKLKASGISGIGMVSNLHPRILSKVAYFSNNSFYVVEKQKPAQTVTERNREKPMNTLRLVNDIGKYKIRYYLHAPASSGKLKSPGFDDIFYENFRDGTGVIPFTPLISDSTSGITLYAIGE